jgi:hypothetical protein
MPVENKTKTAIHIYTVQRVQIGDFAQNVLIKKLLLTDVIQNFAPNAMAKH